MKESIVRLNVVPRPIKIFFDDAMSFNSYRWTNMEVILKVTERCNINCTYCYFFNSINQDFKKHPPYIKSETIEACAKFLCNAAIESGVQTIQIDFHGGEPLMMKKNLFEKMCETLREGLKAIPIVRFAVQTNAMLIDDEWVNIFIKQKIGLGISLDGPKQYHDIDRLDHKGKGSYDRAIRGLKLVQSSTTSEKNISVGVICVINPDNDARKIFDHFVDELNITSLHFLLPMHDHNSFDNANSENLKKYIYDLFLAWTERANKNIRIRYFEKLLALLIGGEELSKISSESVKNHMAFTIASNGDLGPGDDLRNSFPHLFWTGKNVLNTSLIDFLKHPAMKNHFQAQQERSGECESCCWNGICDGGDLIGTEAFRYSNKNGFRNKSIYCGIIEDLLTNMTKFSIDKGVSFSDISKGLTSDGH